jgi:hypothetical protein
MNSQNVTVTLPTALIERLKPFKSFINVSAVLKQALEKELDRLEQSVDGLSEIDSMPADEVRRLAKSLLAQQRAGE